MRSDMLEEIVKNGPGMAFFACSAHF